MTLDGSKPAYPCAPSQAFKGLTIRQAYAMAVLQGMYSDIAVLGAATEGKAEEDCDAAVAKQCFTQADAMIAHENAQAHTESGEASGSGVQRWDSDGMGGSRYNECNEDNNEGMTESALRWCSIA